MIGRIDGGIFFIKVYITSQKCSVIISAMFISGSEKHKLFSLQQCNKKFKGGQGGTHCGENNTRPVQKYLEEGLVKSW